MTKAEIRMGLSSGRGLIQNKDCSTAQEISDVDELVTEGFAHASGWSFGYCKSCGFNERQRRVTKSYPANCLRLFLFFL